MQNVCRGQKINANFFCIKFFENPSGHRRPHRKSWTSAPKSGFSCGPADGEKLFDPWASRRKGRECPHEMRTKKFMFMFVFSSRVWGEENIPKRTPSQKLPEPSFRTLFKELLVCSVVDFCTGKIEQRHRGGGGVENLPCKGGPKSLFGRGVLREVFLPPLFSTPPPTASSDKGLEMVRQSFPP